MIDTIRFAETVLAANARGEMLSPPSAGDSTLDLTTAYRIQADGARLRRAQGHATRGVKVGFANRAAWKLLKLETVLWGPMYDDTVQLTHDGNATLSVGRLRAPKIEPEIVFGLKRPLGEHGDDAAGAIGDVEWLALGFEIVDCPYPDWKFQPVDFVAGLAFHVGLIVGERTPVVAERIPALVDALPAFALRLSKNGELVQEGSGKNVLKSPALCLAELSVAMARQGGVERLAAGDLISTGSLTDPQFIHAGETWSASVEGLDVAPITLQLEA